MTDMKKQRKEVTIDIDIFILQEISGNIKNRTWKLDVRSKGNSVKIDLSTKIKTECLIKEETGRMVKTKRAIIEKMSNSQ